MWLSDMLEYYDRTMASTFCHRDRSHRQGSPQNHWLLGSNSQHQTFVSHSYRSHLSRLLFYMLLCQSFNNGFCICSEIQCRLHEPYRRKKTDKLLQVRGKLLVRDANELSQQPTST